MVDVTEYTRLGDKIAIVDPVLINNRTDTVGTRLIGDADDTNIDITFPPSTSTLATLSLEETLTNKTLTSPVIGGTTLLSSGSRVEDINGRRVIDTDILRLNFLSYSGWGFKETQFIATLNPGAPLNVNISEQNIENITINRIESTCVDVEGFISSSSWSMYIHIKSLFQLRKEADGGHIKIGTDNILQKNIGTPVVSLQTVMSGLYTINVVINTTEIVNVKITLKYKILSSLQDTVS